MDIRPSGVPASIRYKGEKYTFDCMAGTGEPIYQFIKDSGERYHVILAGWKRRG